MPHLGKKYLSDLFFDFASATSTEQLWSRLVRFAEEQGLLHVRVTAYELDVVIGPDTMLYKRTWPEGPASWGETYLKRKLYEHDQSFQLVFRLGRETLEWQEMDKLTRKGTAANRVFVEMREFGIGDGLLVAKSSNISKHTILLGIAGPSIKFKGFQSRNYAVFLQALNTFNSRFLQLALEENELSKDGHPRPIEISQREMEILREFSLDKTSSEVAASLGISVATVNTTIARIKEATIAAGQPIRTREGLIGYFMRTHQMK